MECISQTEKKIVEFLLLNGQTPCKTISQALSVSDKTIRNEIHKINCIDNEPLIYSDQSGFSYYRTRSYSSNNSSFLFYLEVISYH